MSEWGHITPSDGSSMVGEELVWGLGGVGESQIQLPYTTICILQEKNCNEYWYFYSILVFLYLTSNLKMKYFWVAYCEEFCYIQYMYDWKLRKLQPYLSIPYGDLIFCISGLEYGLQLDIMANT